MSKINENTPLGVPQYIIDGWPINNDLKSPVNKAKGGYAPNVTTPAYPVQVPGSRQFSNKALLATLALVPLLPASLVGLSLGSYLLSFAVVALPTFALFNIACSWVFTSGKPQSTAGRPIGDYMTFRDPSLAAAYGNGRIPMEVFFEAYFDKKIDIKMDCLALLENRHDWARFGITYGQLQFFLTQWIPETLWHSRKQDEDQVRDHYDRGDDFYAAFLGPAMIYTSGIIKDAENKESLEQLQYNKLELVCKKTQLKAGEKLLDIGCGWGSLAVHAADRYGVTATGVTLGRNQTKFATERATLRNVKDRVNILCMDYRDIPRTKYNKITCLEMAEHVGVRKFQEFLAQVSDLLEDDGLFFLQIAGLRRAWTYEDFIWGLFMAKYVFPGADASCPLGWVVDQLETAGFEVRDVETIGVHYSATIHRWYLNWMKNRETIVNKYGETWFRRWEFFLAYSTIIARQGSATCYQIVAHKNLNKFDRTVFV